MFFKTKNNTFEEVNNFIISELEKKKFDSALATYHQLKQIYDSSKNQEKYTEEFNLTTRRLLLVAKIQELHELIHTKKIDEIWQDLSEIRINLKERENNLPNFYNYIDKQYERYLRVYLYKQKKEELKIQIDKIHKFMEEENYDFALMQFPETMRIYNEMCTYHRNEEIIKELEQLKSQIKMNIMKQRAYSEPAEINMRRLKALIEKEDIGSSKEKFKDIFERI